jgi:hypothetical protein
MTANLTTRLGQLTSTPAGGPYTGKNRIINGNVSVDQRNAGASQTFTAAAAVAYCVDRFYASCTGANITGQQVAGTAPYQYAYKFTGATSNTGTLFGQRIESLNIADLVSTNVVVQAQIASSTITTVTWTAYYANTTNTFSSKTSIATGTITITSTPTIYTFSFNAGSSAANGVAIEFTTGALASAATLQYSGVQLEAGTIATPYEFNQYAVQSAQCRRYYQKYAEPCCAGYIRGDNGNFSYGFGFVFNSPMRATPSASASGAPDVWVSNTGTGVSFAATALNTVSTTTTGVFFGLSNGSPQTPAPAYIGIGTGWTFSFDAEL